MEKDPITSITRPRWRMLPVVASLVIRLLLFWCSSLPETLEKRIELSTPLTSIQHLGEGVYLHRHGVNPYKGSSFHHSPLYLSIFSTLLDPSSKLVGAAVWTIVDFVAAKALQSIWISRKEAEEDTLRATCKGTAPVDQMVPEGGRRWLREEWKDHVMSLYLLNPYTIATCLARSTTSIDNALVFLSISYAAQGQPPLSIFFLSLAVHSQLYPVLLFAPLCMVLWSATQSSGPAVSGASGKATKQQAMVRWSCLFVGLVVIEYAMGTFLVGSSQFISQTWGTILSVSDLTPNVGLGWYFFTEMFDHFRTFFTGVFQIHVLLYVVPICLRFYDRPLVATMLLSGIIATFKSYPTLGDSTVWLGLLGCFPDIWDELRHPLLTASLALYSTLLLPILLELWLVSATGNANFMYAATMVHSLGCGLGVLDVLGAALRSGVSRETVKLLDADARCLSAGDEGAAKKELRVVRSPGSAISAKRVLEEHDLVVVQYTTLGDDEQ